MTSGNLQRWKSPFFFPGTWNMKRDCGRPTRGVWSTGVEYYSMCISLVFGSLNDAARNIKSSTGLCALIWIVKATLAVNRMQQRKMDITHLHIVKLINEYLIREKIAPLWRIFCWNQRFPSSEKWGNSICMWPKHMHNEWNVWNYITCILYV